MAGRSGDYASVNASFSPTPGAYPSTPGEDDAPTIISTQLSLSQAVYRRRDEFTRSYTTKVKVGTWNVASLTGTDKDVGGWFIKGTGLSEALNGLAIVGANDPQAAERNYSSTVTSVESSGSQEEGRFKEKETLPEQDVAYLPSGDEIGLYVLGLQEIVDVSSATEALRPYSDPHPAKKWKRAVAEALPSGYQLVAEQQLIGLFLVIYASPTLVPQISSVSTTSVGTGLMGYMGNKGAVTARIVLGETTRLVFINCHLSAGAEKGSVDRRNWDAAQIVSRTRFDPVIDSSGVMEEVGEGIGDEDFAFWFGDLNYRLDSMPGEDVRRLLMLHTRNEYGKEQKSRKEIDLELSSPRSPVTIRDGHFVDVDSDEEDPQTTATAAVPTSPPTTWNSGHIEPATDPTSLQATLSSLLPHDQLHAQMRSRKAFHDGWQEGPINFLPTYKYDVDSVGVFDSSEKRRGPSWCDRILYRTRKDKLDYDRKIREEQEAQRAEDQMKARGVDKEAEEESVLFDYDPDKDADNDYQETESQSTSSEVVKTKAGFTDMLHLDYYTSHQRVLSSDHKPLDAVFTLTYKAVDPELKAKIHQEVARELDKAENDGRPVVTIVIDHHHDHDDSSPGSSKSPTFEGVHFGNIKYNHPKTRNITIANTGRVPATVGFVDRPVGEGQLAGVAPPWLNIRFDRPSDGQNPKKGPLEQYTLEPGDATNVELYLNISDITLVRDLNEGREKVEDVLVLRIHNGRDYFLPLRGTWLQSSFGRSLDKLMRIPEGGIRKLQHQRPDRSSHGDEGVKWSAPREVFRLTGAIEELIERTVAEWGMRGVGARPPWEDPAWPFAAWVTPINDREGLTYRIREALDTDQSFTDIFPPERNSSSRLEALAETLLTFLTSLEDGVVTQALWSELEQGFLEREKMKQPLPAEDERMQILEVLSASPPHSILFNLITFMLSRVANEIAPAESGPEASLADRSSRSSKEELRMNQAIHHEKRKRRRQVDASYAAIFADIMIRAPEPSKNRQRKASELRRRHVIESFLNARWEENES